MSAAVAMAEPADLQERLVDQWAVTLHQAGADCLASIIRHGVLLVKAKEEVGHGNWYPLLERIKMSPRHAANLMQIANHPCFQDQQRVADLTSRIPARVGTLVELTSLDEDELVQVVDNGEVTYEMSRGQVRKIILSRRAEAERLRQRAKENTEVCDKLTADGRDAINLYGADISTEEERGSQAAADREDLEAADAEAIRLQQERVEALFADGATGLQGAASRFTTLVARSFGLSLEELLDKRVATANPNLRADARTIAISIIYTQFGADAGLPQARVARAFATESSNVSRVKDAAEVWADYEPLDSIFEGFRMIADGLAQHEELMKGGSA